jgi:hydrogenase maturation protein HypF
MSAEPARARLRLSVYGAVQGVGFRPHVFRLARALALGGTVRNAPSGVLIEVEGAPAALRRFTERMRAEAPLAARISGLTCEDVAVHGDADFNIAESSSAGAVGALLLPDLATCADCVADLFSPHGRHAGYAFTACATCGPRFSVTAALPYDRERTALAEFPLCPACARDYGDPAHRRFHAETQACPVCGPRLSLQSRDGGVVADGPEALRLAADRIRAGGIVAAKGIGGFHLLCRADDEAAVSELRARKSRPAKPFALLFPDIDRVSDWCEVNGAERAALQSQAAPIVLLRRRGDGAAGGVAPGQPRLGAMLPYAPLHHLLMARLGTPVVATSANRGGEPLLFRDADAVATLADAVLTHDRRILRPVEDSVVQFVGDTPIVVRLGRGFAPRAVPLSNPPPLLALGGHLKNAPAVTVGGDAVLGPQLGDLDQPGTLAAHVALVADLCRMHGVVPQAVACDAHPDDVAEAARHGLPVIGVQHHLAHVAAAMAEHRLAGPVLGIAWDGAGHGADGTVWGGEFLLVQGARWRRVGHLHPFPLPGGDAAAREPARAAVGLLAATFGAEWPSVAQAAFGTVDPGPLLAVWWRSCSA